MEQVKKEKEISTSRVIELVTKIDLINLSDLSGSSLFCRHLCRTGKKLSKMASALSDYF